MKTKQCTKCHIEKTIDNYYTPNDYECRSCRAERAKLSRERKRRCGRCNEILSMDDFILNGKKKKFCINCTICEQSEIGVVKLIEGEDEDKQSEVSTRQENKNKESSESKYYKEQIAQLNDKILKYEKIFKKLGESMFEILNTNIK